MMASIAAFTFSSKVRIRFADRNAVAFAEQAA
jgi:hypothetical protein